MASQFSKSDWKTLSRLRPMALERLCARILRGARERIAAAREGESHRAYLDLYQYIQESDEIVARCFNGFRRSQAIFFLLAWRSQGLLTDEEFAAFSPEIRETVDAQLRDSAR